MLFNLINNTGAVLASCATSGGVLSAGAIVGIIIAVIVILIFFFSFVPVGLAISARASGVRVGLFQLVGMRIRKVKPHRIVEPLIKATKAGLKLNIDKMEAHYLAGGNVDRVVNALIASQGAGIDLNFEKACLIDLAGRDVLSAVQMSVSPKVIETPVIAAIAKDGIELRAKAKVTVRVNIDLGFGVLRHWESGLVHAVIVLGAARREGQSREGRYVYFAFHVGCFYVLPLVVVLL